MDKKQMDLEYILSKIGKKVFVDFYYEFKNPNIPVKKL